MPLSRRFLEALRLGVTMSEYLPKDVRIGLEQARKAAIRRSGRLRVMVGDQTFSILRMWDEGFALDIQDAPHLRGLVDVYDGGRHLSQCLIVAATEAAGEMVYEFKRATTAHGTPPRDYAVDENAPVALIAGE